MPSRSLPAAGDIFVAEVGGSFVACKVLWCSPVREHKGSGGFVVFPGVYTDPVDINAPAGDYVPATDSVLVIHTSLRLLQNRRWPIIGNQLLTAHDEQLQLNTRGSGLYRGEEFIRQLNPDEQGHYFPLLAAGRGAVDYYLQQVVARQR